MAGRAGTRDCFLLALLALCSLQVKSQQSPAPSSTAAPKVTDEMEFTDQPHFAVAGVTDWTAAGGHGSDTTLRTSEYLAKATAALGVEKATEGFEDPGTPEAKASAAERRIAAEHEEASGNSLQAVRDYELAAKLDPSEPDLFEWGAELLLHRAIWQAEDVFEKGVAAYPSSLRMQTGLASALFAGARYADAARHLCKASEISPLNAESYLLLGRIQAASADSLPCAEATLAQFIKLQPKNGIAHYLYAMAVLKGHSTPASQQNATQLLLEAVSLDDKCDEAYLQLGVLSAERRDYQQAIRYYQQAITANATLADAHYRLGVAYDRVGRADEAKKEFALHNSLKQGQAAAVEAQRKSVKQFLFAPNSESSAHQ